MMKNYSLRIHDVDDGCQLASIRTIINKYNSTHLDKSSKSLNIQNVNLRGRVDSTRYI